jgi:spermidine dehydrogenase
MDSDRALGMHADISRRDLMLGAAALGLAGAGGLGRGAFAQAAADDGYPPAKTGMRGSHEGSFESAHLLRDGALSLGDATDTGETYDCVIVGGGLSGLAAAHFFLKRVGRDARVLIIENHDDFGGHAKRNEFTVDGKLLVINGGTLNIESPPRYNRWAKQILDDIGVDVARYETANEANSSLYSSLGLQRGYFFDRETWGADKLVTPPSSGGRRGRRLSVEAVDSFPLSPKAADDLKRLLSPEQPDYLAGKTEVEKKAFLATTSFRDYLSKVVGVDDQALWFFQTMGMGSFCVGADATPALYGWMQGYPGFQGLGLSEPPEDLFADLPGGQHGRQRELNWSVHFPDGNATLARLIVSGLIPDAIDGLTQEDMGLARVDYAKLDRDGQAARIRLSSLVVNVRHDGDPATASEAVVSYLQGDRLSLVRAKSVVMACWNMIIPRIAPELPASQQEALVYGVKGPLIYTNVALRNWKSFEALGISGVESPTMFHQGVDLTEAASLGGLEHARTPDEPVALHLVKYMNAPGLPRREQHRVGRNELLALSFETFEREIRGQLARILGQGGFDPARDIAGITVNRWPHGYAYTYNSLYDPAEWVYTESPERPCVIGRQPFGLITIANSDAAASPHTDAAFLEAHRAVNEAIERLTFPFVPRT